MIVITGAAGFIGSCLVTKFNQTDRSELILVDDFCREDKLLNLANKETSGLVHRNQFASWLDENHKRTRFIFHIGARTDTTSTEKAIFDQLNLEYTITIWNKCAEYDIPLLYASSAATYGDGSLGYKDDHDLVPDLKPLNEYARSKNDFDAWALQQHEKPPHWWGLKFFNVYGPNEYHKGRMASVIFHCFQQIQATGKMKLFRSHRTDFADGEQKRDFIYVKDVVDICLFFMQRRPKNGLYNVGTGKARTFHDLVAATFKSVNRTKAISFIDTPIDIRDNYQYFTEASIEKLRSAGYSRSFHTLEDGIRDYVSRYLVNNSHW